jgi:hypothetical protein
MIATGRRVTLRRMQSRWCRGGLLAIVLVAVSASLAAPAALADGDPASDVLLFQNAFFPYSAPSNAAKSKLLGAAAAAKKAGFQVRVAVIQAQRDLGADPELFAKPQLYARFLDAELRSAEYDGALIVVMPQGFGVAAGGTLTKARPPGRMLPAAQRLQPPHTTDPTALTLAGVGAVKAIAAAVGHPIKGPIASVRPATVVTSTPTASGGSSSTLVLGGGLAVLALLAIGMIGIGIRRSRPTDIGG